jgi:hypothetical protein
MLSVSTARESDSNLLSIYHFQSFPLSLTVLFSLLQRSVPLLQLYLSEFLLCGSTVTTAFALPKYSLVRLEQYVRALDSRSFSGGGGLETRGTDQVIVYTVPVP